MIKYKKIGFVAYPVTCMARARIFCEDVPGLKSNGFASGKNPQWIEYDIGAGTLGIGSSEMWKPSKDGVSAALEGEDFDGTVAHLKKHKIKFVLGPMDFPSCRSVTIRDPDGKKLSLHRRKSRRDQSLQATIRPALVVDGPRVRIRSRLPRPARVCTVVDPDFSA